ncbi:MAG: hypothetical protein OJF47_002599 [Nitrospira sp.]|jgi:hypothetical protein|nr:MAG: hypothetical protein OJF47_002599 [Nitrospira sp.]
MFSNACLQILRMAAGKSLTVLALVFLPFPIGIPLALWLTRRNSLRTPIGGQLKPSALITGMSPAPFSFHSWMEIPSLRHLKFPKGPAEKATGPQEAGPRQGGLLMDMELRSSTRVTVTYPVRLLSDALTGQGTVINLSLPGCAVRTDLPVKPGDYLELQVMAPDQARPLTVGLAKVRWAAHQKVGIEFIRVRRDDQSRIQRLIGRLLGESTVEAAEAQELTAA